MWVLKRRDIKKAAVDQAQTFRRQNEVKYRDKWVKHRDKCGVKHREIQKGRKCRVKHRNNQKGTAGGLPLRFLLASWLCVCV